MLTSHSSRGSSKSSLFMRPIALAGAALLSIAGCPTSVNNYGFDEDFGAAAPLTAENTQSPAAVPAAVPSQPPSAPAAPSVSAGAPTSPASPAAPSAVAPAPAASPAPPEQPAAPAGAPADSFRGIVVAPSYIALGPTLSVFVASYPAFSTWRNEDALTVDSAGRLANLTRGEPVSVSYLGDILSATSIAEITMDWWGLGWDVRLADGTSYTTAFTYDNWPGDEVLIVWDLQLGTGAMYMVNMTRNQHVFIYN